MYKTYVTKLTAENIPSIVQWAADRNWTLDHLKDNFEFNAEDGFETILYLIVFESDNEIANFNDVAQDPTQPSVRINNEKTFGPFSTYEKI